MANKVIEDLGVTGARKEKINARKKKTTKVETPVVEVNNGIIEDSICENIECQLQKPIFPTKSSWISQAMNGSTSHRGLFAIDFGHWSNASLKRLGLPTDYDYPIYAPFDCKVTYVDPQSKGAGIALESINKVQFANGDVDYCTVWMGHSNDTPCLYSEFKQGDLVCHFGTAGNAPLHMHLEVIKGCFSEIYANKRIATCTQSVGTVYKLESTIEPYKALYFEKDTYIEDNCYDWEVL